MSGKIKEKFPVRTLKKWSRSSTRDGLLPWRGYKYSDLTERQNGGLLREVVSHGGSTVYFTEI